MKRATMNKRLSALEVRHETRRGGAELYNRLPVDPRNTGAYLETLSNAELDELEDYIDYLISVSPPSSPDPELERFTKVNLKLLTNEELDTLIAEYDAYVEGKWGQND